MTKESFISVCWRLIPYWLNNWEQQWGAECSSMMFELPHFAMELLVVLPCVQVRAPQLPISLTSGLIHSPFDSLHKKSLPSVLDAKCPFDSLHKKCLPSDLVQNTFDSLAREACPPSQRSI